MPCMKTTGSLVVEVWGLCQYIVCLVGERWVVRRDWNRKGKSVKNRERDVRWK